MTEEILKLRIEELTSIRVVYDSGEVTELPVKAAGTHRAKSAIVDFNDHLNGLARCMEFLSSPGMSPRIEFLIPIKK